MSVHNSPAPELLDLPQELLLTILLCLSPEDLAFTSCVAQSLRFEQRLDGRWRQLYEEAFNSSAAATPLQERAAKLAGSWKALYASKTVKERELQKEAGPCELPWEEPCSFELQVALDGLLAAAPPAANSLDTSVMFLLDGSGSVTEDDFRTMTDFVASALETVARTHPAAKASIVQFSNEFKVEVHPQAIDCSVFTTKLEAMTRMNGGTNIALAIAKSGQLLKAADADLVAQRAASDMLLAERHPCKVLVLLTDGRVDTYQAHEAMVMAERLADEQGPACLHAFGVGRGVDKTELLRIISACGDGEAEQRYTALRVLSDEGPW